MTGHKITHYRLTPAALSDLEEIWRYSSEQWSEDQADRYIDKLEHLFGTLVLMPALGRDYPEFTPPVRIHVHEAHLVIYTINQDHIAIQRILGGKQDWRSILVSVRN